jgi:hypothetical protein
VKTHPALSWLSEAAPLPFKGRAHIPKLQENAMSESVRTNNLDYDSTTAGRRVSTETKSSVKTTEIIAYVVVALAVLIAAQISDGFQAKDAWFFVTLLTIGYMISRGLAKSGSRDFYDDNAADRNHR